MPSSKYSAQEIDFGPPYNVGSNLPLDFLLNWNLEDYSNRSLYFEHRNDTDVELTIMVSQELTPDITLDLVMLEVSNYLNGVSSDPWLITQLFIEDDYYDDDDFDDDDFDDDDFDFVLEEIDFDEIYDFEDGLYFEFDDVSNFDIIDIDFTDDDLTFDDDDIFFDDDNIIYVEDESDFEIAGVDEVIDIDQLGFEDVSEFSIITFNNIDWWMIQFASPVIITEYPSDGPGYVESVGYDRHIVFITQINNRIYSVDMSASVDSYFEYELDMFDAMSEISQFSYLLLGLE
jgi:hypothetical protein